MVEPDQRSIAFKTYHSNFNEQPLSKIKPGTVIFGIVVRENVRVAIGEDPKLDYYVIMNYFADDGKVYPINTHAQDRNRKSIWTWFYHPLKEMDVEGTDGKETEPYWKHLWKRSIVDGEKFIYWQPLYANWATLEDPTMQHPTSPGHRMIYERFATQEEINAAAEEAHRKQEEEQSAVGTDPPQTDRKRPLEEDTEEDKPAEKKPNVTTVLTLQEQQRVNEAREEGKKALENCRSISRTAEERKTCIAKAKEEDLKALQKCRTI